MPADPSSDAGATLLARQPRALQLLRSAGILPILTVDSVDQARAMAEALLRGGLTSIELTLLPLARAGIRVVQDRCLLVEHRRLA